MEAFFSPEVIMFFSMLVFALWGASFIVSGNKKALTIVGIVLVFTGFLISVDYIFSRKTLETSEFALQELPDRISMDIFYTRDELRDTIQDIEDLISDLYGKQAANQYRQNVNLRQMKFILNFNEA